MQTISRFKDALHVSYDEFVRRFDWLSGRAVPRSLTFSLGTSEILYLTANQNVRQIPTQVQKV